MRVLTIASTLSIGSSAVAKLRRWALRIGDPAAAARIEDLHPAVDGTGPICLDRHLDTPDRCGIRFIRVIGEHCLVENVPRIVVAVCLFSEKSLVQPHVSPRKMYTFGHSAISMTLKSQPEPTPITHGCP